MKKVKLLFLITLIIITCTGCTVEYNININKDNIEEVINVTDYITSTRTREDILNHYNMWYPTFVNYIKEGETIELEDFSVKANGVIYHEKNINQINNGYNYTYKYTYDIEDYYDSYVLASSFIETTVHEDSDTLVLKTSKKNLLCQYNYFDSAKVNITIDPEIYELNYTNTSNIKNNTYSWNINRNNCDDSQIILTLNKKIQGSQPSTNNIQNNNKNSILSNYMIYIFFIVLAIIIFVGYKWFEKFKNKNNNID